MCPKLGIDYDAASQVVQVDWHGRAIDGGSRDWRRLTGRFLSVVPRPILLVQLRQDIVAAGFPTCWWSWVTIPLEFRSQPSVTLEQVRHVAGREMLSFFPTMCTSRSCVQRRIWSRHPLPALSVSLLRLFPGINVAAERLGFVCRVNSGGRMATKGHDEDQMLDVSHRRARKPDGEGACDLELQWECIRAAL